MYFVKFTHFETSIDFFTSIWVDASYGWRGIWNTYEYMTLLFKHGHIFDTLHRTMRCLYYKRRILILEEEEHQQYANYHKYRCQ